MRYLNNYRKSKCGFLFVIASLTLMLVGFFALVMHWFSQNQSFAVHKLLLADQANTMALSGVNLMIEAIREGIVSGENPLKTEGFYKHFLPDHHLFTEEHMFISHEQMMDFLPAHYHDRLGIWLKGRPAKATFQAQIVRVRNLFEQMIFDGAQKMVDLKISCTVDYLGSVRTVSKIRQIMVYSLLSPLTSKFTFYHKSAWEEKYRTLIVDPEGNKIAKNHVLYLYNGPLESSFDLKTDIDIFDLEKDKSPLYSAMRLKDSRQALEKRGFLYFGPGNSHLRLTSGKSGDGQYFHIWPSSTFQIEPPPRIYRPPDSQLPSYLQKFAIKTFVPLSDYGEQIRSELAKGLYSFTLDGFSDSVEEIRNDFFSGYDPYSEKVHPFGSLSSPSRAYVAGNAFQDVVRLARLRVDYDLTAHDEKRQKACSSYKSDADAFAGNVQNLDEDSFESKTLFVKFQETTENINFSTCKDEPKTLIFPSRFKPYYVFEEYEIYQKFMSGIISIPMKQIVDYPHYANDWIPCQTHPQFENFLISSQNTYKNSSKLGWEEGLSSMETFLMDKSKLHAENSIYFSGEIDFFDPDLYQEAIIVDKLQVVEKKEKNGRTRGRIDLGSKHLRAISGDFDVRLNSLIFSDHLNLWVNGDCHFKPFQTQNYVHFNCNNIYLYPDLESDSKVEIFTAFFSARNKIYRVNAKKKLLIYGGLSIKELDNSFFQAPVSVLHNLDYSPLKEIRNQFYRMRMNTVSMGFSYGK